MLHQYDDRMQSIGTVDRLGDADQVARWIEEARKSRGSQRHWSAEVLLAQRSPVPGAKP